MTTRTPLPLCSFITRVLATLALVALAVVAWQLAELWLVVFGACVVAVLLQSGARVLRRHVPMPQMLSLGLVVVILALMLVLLMWMFGAQLAGQLDAFQQKLPAAWAQFQLWLQGNPLGASVQEMLGQVRADSSAMAERAGMLAKATTSALVQAGLMLIGGLYLAAQPSLYHRGVLKLVPARRRVLVGDALADTGHALRAWLRGQLLAMVVVGVLTGLGMWALGVPVALGIGLLTALLDFIPIVGPILAAVPAILLGFTVSPQVALWVAVLFVVVQQIEGNVLQPLIQQRAVDLPPALLLFALFGIGLLFGPMGVVLAAPMTVVGYVLVKRLYVREALQTPTPIPGRD